MTRFRRSASLVLAASLLGAALVATVAAPASAHTPSASATCSTLAVSLQSYSTTQNNSKPNKVSVSIDGSVVAAEWFGTSFARDFSLGDSARAHTWRVAIDAVDNGYDRTFDGTSTPCPPPTPRDAAANVQTTPPTCTAPGKLVLNTPSNATWSTPSGAQGPSTYSVTATASKGHAFDDGKSTRAFTGSLPGALDPASAACKTQTGPTTPTTPTTPPTPPRPTPPPAKPVTPAKPAPLLTSTRTVTVDCDELTVVTKTSTTSIDWTFDSATNTWVQAKPTSTVVSSHNPAPETACGIVSPAGGTPPAVVAVAAGGGGAGVGALAHAGLDSMLAIAGALALLVAGLVLALARRRKAAAATEE